MQWTEKCTLHMSLSALVIFLTCLGLGWSLTGTHTSAVPTNLRLKNASMINFEGTPLVNWKCRSKKKPITAPQVSLLSPDRVIITLVTIVFQQQNCLEFSQNIGNDTSGCVKRCSRSQKVLKRDCGIRSIDLVKLTGSGQRMFPYSPQNSQ